MLTTFAENANNDLFLDESGNIAMVTGIEAVLFTCQAVAETQLGELIYAINAGIPNFQVIWNGNPNVQQFEAFLRRALLSVPGVVDIQSVDVSIVNNDLLYQVTILTTFGVGVLNGQL